MKRKWLLFGFLSVLSTQLMASESWQDQCYDGEIFYDGYVRLKRTFGRRWTSKFDPLIEGVTFAEVSQHSDTIKLKAMDRDLEVLIELRKGQILFDSPGATKAHRIANMGFGCTFNPWKVNHVSHNGRGTFHVIDYDADAPLRWVEKNASGVDIGLYVELERFPTAIILKPEEDHSGQGQVTLDLSSKVVHFGSGRESRQIMGLRDHLNAPDLKLWNVKKVYHDRGGSFEIRETSNGNFVWVEKDHFGYVIYEYQTSYLNSDNIELVSGERKLSVLLNFRTHQVRLRVHGEGSNELYHITGVEYLR